MWFNHQLNNIWRIGADFQDSDYRYRFIDTRLIQNGFSSELKAFGLARIADNDIIAKIGLRWVQVSENESQDFNYVSENSLKSYNWP